jgi:hypothetical protein
VEYGSAHSHHPFPRLLVPVSHPNLIRRVGQVEDPGLTCNGQDWLMGSYAGPYVTMECEQKISVMTYCEEASWAVARRVFAVEVVSAVDR